MTETDEGALRELSFAEAIRQLIAIGLGKKG